MALTTNLEGYWKFDETSGASAADATGNGNTMTLYNSPTWTSSGKINNGLSLARSSSQYGEVPATWDDAGFSALTIAAWVNLTDLSDFSLIATNYYTAAPTDFVEFRINPDGTLFMTVGHLTSSNYGGSISVGTVGTGSFHHIVGVWDGGTSYTNFPIYIDKVSQSLTDGSSGTFSGSYSPSTNPLKIGRLDLSTVRYFNGIIDELAIWSRALSSTEVSQLYNSGSGLQYPFTGGGSSALFRPKGISNPLNGLGAGGPFFGNPLGRSMLGWRKSLAGLLIPELVIA